MAKKVNQIVEELLYWEMRDIQIRKDISSFDKKASN